MSRVVLFDQLMVRWDFFFLCVLHQSPIIVTDDSISLFLHRELLIGRIPWTPVLAEGGAHHAATACQGYGGAAGKDRSVGERRQPFLV